MPVARVESLCVWGTPSSCSQHVNPKLTSTTTPITLSSEEATKRCRMARASSAVKMAAGSRYGGQASTV